MRYDSSHPNAAVGSSTAHHVDIESISYTSPLLSFVERKPKLPAAATTAPAPVPAPIPSDTDTLTIQATTIDVKGLKKADRGMFDTRKNNVYVKLTLQNGEGKKTPVRTSGGSTASYNFETIDKSAADTVKWEKLMTIADVKAATSGLSLRVEVYDEDKLKGDQLLGQGSLFVRLKDVIEGGTVSTELISLDNITLGYDPKGKPLGTVALRLQATRNSNVKKGAAALPVFLWPGKVQIERPLREQALGKYVIMDKEGDLRGLVTRIEGQGKKIQVQLLDDNLRVEEGQYEWVNFGGKGEDGMEMLWYVDAPALRKTLDEAAAATPTKAAAVDGLPPPLVPLVTTTLTAPVKAGDSRIQVESQVGCAAGMIVQIGGGPLPASSAASSSSSSSSAAASASGSKSPSDVRKIVGFGSIIVDAPLANSYPAGTTVLVFSADKAPPLTVKKDAGGDMMDEMGGPPTGGDQSAPPPLVAPKVKQPQEPKDQDKDKLKPTTPAVLPNPNLTGPQWPGKIQIERPVREQALGKYVIMDKEGDDRGLVTRIEGQKKKIQVQLFDDENLRLLEGQFSWISFDGKAADGTEMLWYIDDPNALIITAAHVITIQATAIDVKGLKKADRGMFDTRKNNVYVKLTLQNGEGKKTPVRTSGGSTASYNFETTDKSAAETMKWEKLMTMTDVKAATSGLSLRVEVFDEDKKKGDQLLGEASLFVRLKEIVEGGSISTELISLDNITLGNDPKGKPLGSVAVRLQVVATPGGGKVGVAAAAPPASAVIGSSAAAAVAGGGGAIVQPTSTDATSTIPSKEKDKGQGQVKGANGDTMGDMGGPPTGGDQSAPPPLVAPKDKQPQEPKDQDKGKDKDKDQEKAKGPVKDKESAPAPVTGTVIAADATPATVASSTGGKSSGEKPKRPPPKVPTTAAGAGNASPTIAPIGDATTAGAGTGTDAATGTVGGKSPAATTETTTTPATTATAAAPVKASTTTPTTTAATVIAPSGPAAGTPTPTSATPTPTVAPINPTDAAKTKGVGNAPVGNVPTSTTTTPTPANEKQPPVLTATAAAAGTTATATATATAGAGATAIDKTATDKAAISSVGNKTGPSPSPSPSPSPVVASTTVGTDKGTIGTPVAVVANTTATTAPASAALGDKDKDKDKDKSKDKPSPAVSSTTTPAKATNPSTNPAPTPAVAATSSPVKSSTSSAVNPIVPSDSTGTGTGSLVVGTGTGIANNNSSSAVGKGAPTAPANAGATNATPISANVPTTISDNKPKTPQPAAEPTVQEGKKLAPLGGAGTGASVTLDTLTPGKGSASLPVLAPIGGGSSSKKPALAPITTPANK